MAAGEKLKRGRSATFEKMWQAVGRAVDRDFELPGQPVLPSRAAVPYLNEPWYC